MTNENWRSAFWRTLRGVVATAVAQTVVLQVDWSNPEVATKALVASFVAGLLMGLSKVLRDWSDNKFVQKLLV